MQTVPSAAAAAAAAVTPHHLTGTMPPTAFPVLTQFKAMIPALSSIDVLSLLSVLWFGIFGTLHQHMRAQQQQH
jgi:hypothetical protein